MWFKPLLTLNDCTLSAHQVDVWHFPLSELPENAMALLNPEEQTRANRYHFARHQRRFTAARAGLRLILARYLNTNPAALQFTENKYGKPALLPPYDALQFNLSHSKDSALLGIGLNDELGIDLEYYSQRPFLGIAKHVFSPTEIEALTQIPPEAQTATFFTVWAQKEAFIKAVGLGLSYPLKEFDVPTHVEADCELIDNLTQLSWRLIAFMLNPQCAAALCINPKTRLIRRIELENLNDLHDTQGK